MTTTPTKNRPTELNRVRNLVSTAALSSLARAHTSKSCSAAGNFAPAFQAIIVDMKGTITTMSAAAASSHHPAPSRRGLKYSAQP